MTGILALAAAIAAVLYADWRWNVADRINDRAQRVCEDYLDDAQDVLPTDDVMAVADAVQDSVMDEFDFQLWTIEMGGAA